MDFVSLATVGLQISVAILLVRARAGLSTQDAAMPGLARRTLTVLVIVGIALGAASYDGAMAAEASIPWLGEGETPHHAESTGEPLDGSSPPPHGDDHPH